MNRTSKILAVVLAIQLVLLGVRAVWPSSSENTTTPGGVLVGDFDPAQVTQFTIANNNDQQITVKKVDDQWVLPDYGDYPVESTRVSTLLDKVKQLRADRLITQSETSFRRLQVSPDDFVRLIAFEQAGGASHTLYLGKTGGGSTVHVRLDNQNQVYLVNNLSSQDANAAPSNWIDTTYFSVPSDNIQSLRLQNANGDFEFTKTDGTWTTTGLDAGEVLNQDNLTQLLNGIASLRMSAPIGQEASDDFALDTPQATITITVLETVASESGAVPTPDTSNLLGVPAEASPTPAPTATPQQVEKEYTFQIGAALDDGVVIKGSNSDYYVLITQATADRFTGKTRDDFVSVPPTPTPEPTLTPNPPETDVPMSIAPTPTAE